MSIATEHLQIVAPPAKGGCRFCGEPLRHTFVNLGMAPPCQNFLSKKQLEEPETYYPLHAFVCEHCFLVQVEEYVSGEEIFGGEYAYFSSYSTSWLAHAAHYVEMITSRLKLNQQSQVIEIASNDGYLLRNFVKKNIPALGIEPAANCAAAARAHGVQSLVKFFGAATATYLADQGMKADLLIANNVLAHTPQLNDFVAGIQIILAENGTATLEFPHLLRLMAESQFDTIYQEHYSYFSLLTLVQVFAKQGLKIFDVQELSTHGGSLRIFVCRKSAERSASPAVKQVLQAEQQAGLNRLAAYQEFAVQVEETKRSFLAFLIEARRAGKRIVGYGAPGKGSTLLNYCGVRQDFLDFLVDKNPYKQGRFMPGARIPILPPEAIAGHRPDYIVILPWNLKDEIIASLDYVRAWGCKFVIPIPQTIVLD